MEEAEEGHAEDPERAVVRGVVQADEGVDALGPPVLASHSNSNNSKYSNYVNNSNDISIINSNNMIMIMIMNIIIISSSNNNTSRYGSPVLVGRAPVPERNGR